jgi:FAD/FMN-containing dehydrogenase
VIVSATFKLFPLPPSSRTIAADVPDAAAAAALAAAVNGSQLTPSAIEIAGPPFSVLIRFESVEPAVAAQSEIARRLATAAGAAVRELDGPEETGLWANHAARVWGDAEAVARIAVLPTELPGTLALAEEMLPAGWQVIGRAGLGVLYLGMRGGRPAADPPPYCADRRI